MQLFKSKLFHWMDNTLSNRPYIRYHQVHYQNLRKIENKKCTSKDCEIELHTYLSKSRWLPDDSGCIQMTEITMLSHHIPPSAAAMYYISFLCITFLYILYIGALIEATVPMSLMHWDGEISGCSFSSQFQIRQISPWQIPASHPTSSQG